MSQRGGGKLGENGGPPVDPVGDTVGASPARDLPGPAAGPPGPLLAGRYQVLRELGRGGMGRVVVALDTKLGREVAIKELLVDAPHLRDRFSREVRLSAVLQHPSIVCLYEAFELDNGLPCYLMRVVSGHPLHQLLAERGRLSDRIALLPNVIQVCEAMAYAHQQGVIHRDLKPGNVMVGQFGETVVIDWGLAKQRGTTESSDPPSQPPSLGGAAMGPVTLQGEVMGTPAYMAPEQARGEPADARSDVYSLGAILYEVLAGRPPYLGDTHADVLSRLLSGPPDSSSLASRGVPRDLLGIAERAMRREPSERYASAAELAEDLRRFQTGQLVRARSYSWLELGQRWLARHRLSVTAAAALLLTLGSAGGAYWRWARVTIELCDAVAPAIPELQGSVAPRCLRPLSPEVQQHRRLSYRLTSSHGRVTRIERINGWGLLAHTHLDDLARWDLSYDDSGQLHEEVATNPHGDFRERWVFSADLRRAERRDADGAPLERVTSGLVRRSDASVALRDLDAQGRVVRLRTANVFGSPRPGVAPWALDDLRNESHGTFGFRLDLDEAGEIVGATSLGPDGTERVDGDGILLRVFRRDPGGAEVSQRYYDSARQPVVDRLGIAGVTLHLDAAGNVVGGTFLGRDGRPTVSFLGISGYRVELDAHGYEVGWSGLGLDGEPTPLDHGIDDDFAGYVTARRTYDQRGVNTGVSFFDAEGRPVVTRVAGCARIQYVPNAEGQIEEEDCFDASGQRAIYRYFGASGARFGHDANGFPNGMAFLGLQGEPMVSLRYGCAQIDGTNDANNNTLDKRCLGLDGQPLVAESSYQPHGYQPWHYPRYAHWHFTRDSQGREIGQSFFDARDQPLAQKEGYAATVRRLDEAGNAVETSRIGVDGGLVAGTDGVARETAEYDAYGYCTQVASFDAEGRPVVSRTSGASRLRRRYDDYGHAVEEAAFGVDGQPANVSGDTYSIRRLGYDGRSDLIEESYFDSSGAPVRCRAGYSVKRLRYDDHSAAVEEAYLDVDGGPALSQAGYARVTRTYGVGAQLLEERYWGLDGGPGRDLDGASGYRQEYDGRGNLTRRLFLGPDSSLGSDPAGVAIEVRAYSGLDELVRVARLQCDGGPATGPDGSYGFASTYDAYGREATRTPLVAARGRVGAGAESAP